LLLCCLELPHIASLPSCLALPCCLVAITPQVLLQPPHFLFCCLIASCLATSLPCYLVTLCWLVFPSSLLFCMEVLGAWRSKLSSNERRLVFFCEHLVFFCLFFFVK
jgi:hypothetical protein